MMIPLLIGDTSKRKLNFKESVKKQATNNAEMNLNCIK